MAALADTHAAPSVFDSIHSLARDGGAYRGQIRRGGGDTDASRRWVGVCTRLRADLTLCKGRRKPGVACSAKCVGQWYRSAHTDVQVHARDVEHIRGYAQSTRRQGYVQGSNVFASAGFRCRYEVDGRDIRNYAEGRSGEVVSRTRRGRQWQPIVARRTGVAMPV